MRRFTFFLFYSVFGLMVGGALLAVPAMPGFAKFVQPDGSSVTIQLVGDENLSYVYSQDGYTLLHKDGCYYYAMHNQAGDLVPSNVVARDVKNKSTDVAFLQDISKGLAYSEAQLASRRVKRIPFEKESGLKASGIQSTSFPTKGKLKLLLILVNFSDTQVTYSQDDFNDYMNKEGFNGKGSFRDYYLENSYDQLDIQTTVTRWVTVSKPHKYYGENDDAKAYELLVEAINILDEEINFKDFDNNNDGVVDGIAMIHQGQGEEFTGSDPNNIWSHSWDLGSALKPASAPKRDGVFIKSYTIQPEIMAGKGNTAMSTIGVMCHEFGHNLGAPDYYDTSKYGSNNGTGQWDLMASGSWNGLSGDRPAHHNPYQKAEYGWLSLKDLPENGSVVLKPVMDKPDVYKINTATPGEFFVLENRQRKGVFEAVLPGSGMVIYHVDENFIRQKYFGNKINVGNHQGLYPIVASGVMSNPNTRACPFPGSNNVTAFTDATSPASLSWSGEYTLRPLTNIAKSGEDITFSVATVVPACVAPVNVQASLQGLNKVNINWSAGEDVFYNNYNVYRDGVLVAEGISAMEYIDASAPVGINTYAISNVSNNGGSESERVETRVYCAPAAYYQAYEPVATVSQASVVLSWKNPVVLYDGFEDMTPFIVDPPSANGWSYIDGDLDWTYGFSESYSNNGVATSFVCFNPQMTEPAITDPYAQPFRGSQYMASFSAASFMTTTDDWLISKKLELDKPHRLVFYAKGHMEKFGKEEINVGVSKTENNSSDFEFINGNVPILLNEQWTRYEFTIPADAKYFAIHCQTSAVYLTMVDELTLLAHGDGDQMIDLKADVYPASQITGFNIYRNNTLVFANVQGLTVTDVVPMRGSYEYTIETLVEDKKPFARVTLPVNIKETAVEQPSVGQGEVVLYPNPASGRFSVRCEGHRFVSLDLYNIAGNLVLSSSNNNGINIAGLPVGYYIVKVKTDQGQFVKRLRVK